MTTLPFPDGDPLEFFARLRATERMPSYAVVGEWAVISWNPRRTIAGDERALDTIEECLRRRKQPASRLPFTGGMIGYVGYDAGCALLGVRTKTRDGPRMPEICFHEYDNAVLIRGKTLTVVGDAAFHPLCAQHSCPPAAGTRGGTDGEIPRTNDQNGVCKSLRPYSAVHS